MIPVPTLTPLLMRRRSLPRQIEIKRQLLRKRNKFNPHEEIVLTSLEPMSILLPLSPLRTHKTFRFKFVWSALRLRLSSIMWQSSIPTRRKNKLCSPTLLGNIYIYIYILYMIVYKKRDYLVIVQGLLGWAKEQNHTDRKPKTDNIILKWGMNRYKWYHSIYLIKSLVNEDIGLLKGGVIVIVISPYKENDKLCRPTLLGNEYLGWFTSKKT